MESPRACLPFFFNGSCGRGTRCFFRHSGPPPPAHCYRPDRAVGSPTSSATRSYIATAPLPIPPSRETDTSTSAIASTASLVPAWAKPGTENVRLPDARPTTPPIVAPDGPTLAWRKQVIREEIAAATATVSSWPKSGSVSATGSGTRSSGTSVGVCAGAGTMACSVRGCRKHACATSRHESKGVPLCKEHYKEAATRRCRTRTCGKSFLSMSKSICTDCEEGGGGGPPLTPDTTEAKA